MRNSYFSLQVVKWIITHRFKFLVNADVRYLLTYLSAGVPVPSLVHFQSHLHLSRPLEFLLGDMNWVGPYLVSVCHAF